MSDRIAIVVVIVRHPHPIQSMNIDAKNEHEMTIQSALDEEANGTMEGTIFQRSAVVQAMKETTNEGGLRVQGTEALKENIEVTTVIVGTSTEERGRSLEKAGRKS